MAQLLLPVLARAVRALAKWPFGPAVAVLPELHASRARPPADGAHVDDVAGADDGLGVGAGVSGVGLVSLERLHVEGEDVLHLLHGWGVGFGWGWGGYFWQRVCVVVEVGLWMFWLLEKGLCVCCCCCLVKCKRTGGDCKRGARVLLSPGETKTNRTDYTTCGRVRAQT